MVALGFCLFASLKMVPCRQDSTGLRVPAALTGYALTNPGAHTCWPFAPRVRQVQPVSSRYG